MEITWLIGGLEVPGIGISKEGVSINIPEEQATSLIKQGIAKKMKKKSKKQGGD